MDSELKTRVALIYGGRILELPPGEYILGRSSSCSLRFNDANVSRQHLRFNVKRGGVTVRDLGSKNGTSVNGMRLSREVALAHGDRLELGRLQLIVALQPEGEFYEEDTVSVTGQKNPILDASSATVSCPSCEAKVPETLDSCPHCGCGLEPGRSTCMTQELPLFDPGD